MLSGGKPPFPTCELSQLDLLCLEGVTPVLVNQEKLAAAATREVGVGVMLYKFTRAPFAAVPSPLSGALNLLGTDQGFPERHPWLNSVAPSGAENQIQACHRSLG